ncbi:TetR family transcriptional regulator [Komagataeibacter rhaeticus]|nr:TetR family transcriptional regulator [Komagataeibacter rhaeticus]
MLPPGDGFLYHAAPYRVFQSMKHDQQRRSRAMTPSTHTGRPAPQPRNAEATRQRILNAARTEFAANGLDGARVDTIALAARANKRMIYHYFENKENLFRVVLERAYLDIRTKAARLDLEARPPLDAIRELVRFTWNYYISNPEFITLVNTENLCNARHIRTSRLLRPISHRFMRRVQALLDRGAHDGMLRPGLDAVQLVMTITAICHYYFTSRHTASVLFSRDFSAPEALRERLDFNMETIMCLVRRDRAGTAGDGPALSGG